MIPFAAVLLVKVTAIALLALGGRRFARRRSAAVRHVLLSAAFAAPLVLPFASLVTPAIQVLVPINAPASAALAAP